MSYDRNVHAFVLAGRRSGGVDPLSSIGANHKGLIEICGKAMIVRVLETLNAVDVIKDITIAAPHDIRGDIATLGGPAHDYMDAAGSPSRSIAAALDMAKGKSEILVTTCDHPLLTPAMVEEFLHSIDRRGLGAAAACVTRENYEAAYPQTRRTFIKLKDFAFSGANLFWFSPARAKALIEFWRNLEDNRKNPALMAREIGPHIGILYAMGMLTKKRALDRIEKKTGVNGKLIALSAAEAAIDVDKPEDIDLVSQILKTRSP